MEQKIKTGIKCPYCGADDCRKFEIGGYFPSVSYVCPKCAKRFTIEKE